MSDSLERALEFPFDLELLFQKKKAIRRLLLEKKGPFLEKRIAILGGSTTAEIRDILELFLLKEGIQPTFYESDYNRYFEDVMFENPTLDSFHPEILYIHTTWRNLQHHPQMTDTPAEVENKLKAEMVRIQSLWEKAGTRFKDALLIQNNVELPPLRVLGNLDFSEFRGEVHFVHTLNARLMEAVAQNKQVRISDIHYLAAAFGLDRWHDPKVWHAYKYACAYDAIPWVAHNISRMIAAACGKSKKVLVVDLDNTLWGGTAGDDGIQQIQIGHETAEGEAYLAFQTYLKELRARGVVLGVASKNNPNIALEGLRHPEGVLKPEDFASIQANWDDKDQSLRKIADTLALGTDSFVFVDDNPVEREWVRGQVPGATIPELPAEVSLYPLAIDRAGYFEPAELSQDDMARSRFYQENNERVEAAQQFANYDDFLKSLDIQIEINSFSPVYFDRITQLINKTNQFNLTTRRMTPAEVQTLAKDSKTIALYGKLKDRFGDNGLVSVIVARTEGKEAHIDLWLMSCRVLKRRMEYAMLKALIEECHRRGIDRLIGYYIPTPKNDMVKQFYQEMGFTLKESSTDGKSRWERDLLMKERKAA